MNVDNPMYGDNCNTNTDVRMRAENDYIVNVYSNPMLSSQMLLAKNRIMELQKSNGMTSAQTPNMAATSTVTSSDNQDDGYEEPIRRPNTEYEQPHYYPMDGNPETEIIIRRERRPVAQEYIMPQDSNIYEEIDEYPPSDK